MWLNSLLPMSLTDTAPCPLVLRTALCFSNGPGVQKLPALAKASAGQTVHELNPDLSAMLDYVTTGFVTIHGIHYIQLPSGDLPEANCFAGGDSLFFRETFVPILWNGCRCKDRPGDKRKGRPNSACLIPQCCETFFSD